MPEENTFDRISRVLATPMPRRRALKVAFSLATSAMATSFLQSNSLGASSKKGNIGAKKQPLDYPITNLSLKDVQVYNIIKALQYQYQVPVSFIDASDKTEDTLYNPAKPNAPGQLIAVGHPVLTFDIKKGTARDVLNQLVKQDPTYQYGMVEGRLIVYPKQPKFETVVSGVDIRNEPRGEAAVKYVFSTLAKRVRGFESYGTAIGRYGEGQDAPIYMVPVTLSSQGTVVSQLVQLLGSDPSMVLFVTRNSSGDNLFQFDTVGPQPPLKPLELILPSPSAGGSPKGAHGSIPHAATASTSSSRCRPTNIVYGERRSSTPSASGCGITDVYAVTGITICSGDDCTGQTETENATQQTTNPSGLPVCNPGSGTNFAGCGAIYDKDSFSHVNQQGQSVTCGDSYGAPGLTTARFSTPGYMCQDTFTQTISVTGSPVNPFATATMVFTRSVDSKGVCKASISPPSFSSLVTCCGVQPSAPDPYTLCVNATQVCVSDNGTANAICCPTGTIACNHVCCQPDSKCITDNPSLLPLCCPSNTTYACGGVCCQPGQNCATDGVTKKIICCPSSSGNPGVACDGVCCPPNNTCTGGKCCPKGQATSDNKLCCPSGQSPYGTICCTTGQNNCNGKCCANTCCGTVCCQPGQTCAGGMCCGQPTPQSRMSAEAVTSGSYATDNLALCCPPGQPPCGNVCCASGSVCCGGTCCAGTCDSTGVCIPPPNENK